MPESDSTQRSTLCCCKKWITGPRIDYKEKVSFEIYSSSRTKLVQTVPSPGRACKHAIARFRHTFTSAQVQWSNFDHDLAYSPVHPQSLDHLLLERPPSYSRVLPQTSASTLNSMSSNLQARPSCLQVPNSTHDELRRPSAC